jgi:hypothetical protein
MRINKSSNLDHPQRAQGEVVNFNRPAQFLYDIQIFLGYEYAQFEHHLFFDFAPEFSQLRDLPLAEHLAQAYANIHDARRRASIRELIGGALERCSNAPLGVRRSFVIIDLAHRIAPELFSNELWRKLLWRVNEPTALSNWVGSLFLKWAQWNIEVTLSESEILKAIDIVAPSLFLNLIEYVSTLTIASSETSLVRIINAASIRIKRDHLKFTEDEIDHVEINDFLNGILIIKKIYVFESTLTTDSIEEQYLKDELNRVWGEEEPCSLVNMNDMYFDTTESISEIV